MFKAESQKKSAKGSNLKEDDSAFALQELLLFGWKVQEADSCQKVGQWFICGQNKNIPDLTK